VVSEFRVTSRPPLKNCFQKKNISFRLNNNAPNQVHGQEHEQVADSYFDMASVYKQLNKYHSSFPISAYRVLIYMYIYKYIFMYIHVYVYIVVVYICGRGFGRSTSKWRTSALTWPACTSNSTSTFSPSPETRNHRP